MLDYINNRLTELEKEKQELTEFQTKDRERRCLEYTLYQREVDKFEDQIAAIDAERDLLIERTLNHEEGTMETHQARLEDIESRLRGLESDRQVCQTERVDLLHELDDLYRERAELQIAVEELQANAITDTASREVITNELAQLEKSIAAKSKNLQKLTDTWNKQLEEEQALDLEYVWPQDEN